MAAVPGAEWRVPLWNTAGFEPRRGARLRRATVYYYYYSCRLHRASSLPLLVLHTASPAPLPSPTTPPGTSARSRRSLPLSSDSAADNSGDDDVPISLRKHRRSPRPFVSRNDGRDGQKEERRCGMHDGRVFILFGIICIGMLSTSRIKSEDILAARARFCYLKNV